MDVRMENWEYWTEEGSRIEYGATEQGTKQKYTMCALLTHTFFRETQLVRSSVGRLIIDDLSTISHFIITCVCTKSVFYSFYSDPEQSHFLSHMLELVLSHF